MPRPHRPERHHVLERWQDLDFDLDLPAGWRVELPGPEAIDFDAEPARMQPLLQAGSADGSLRLDIGARPYLAVLPLVYSAAYYLGERALMPIDDGGQAPFGGGCAIVGHSLQGEGDAAQIVRHAHLADGERIVEVLLRGPQSRVAELLPVWRLLEQSFRLHRPRGEPLLAGTEAAAPANGWWARAQALQQQGDIDQALALVARECRAAGGLLAQAELMADHMRDALAAGRADDAQRAHDRACHFAWAYAASATSGGEGAALSLERDRFLAALGPAPAVIH